MENQIQKILLLCVLIILSASCANRKFIRESIANDYSVYSYFKHDSSEIQKMIGFNYERRGAHTFTFINTSSLQIYCTISFSDKDTILHSDFKSYMIDQDKDSFLLSEIYKSENSIARKYSMIFEDIHWYYSNHKCVNEFTDGVLLDIADIEINISGLHYNFKGKSTENFCKKDFWIDDFWYYRISDKWNKAERKYFIKSAKRKFKVK